MTPGILAGVASAPMAWRMGDRTLTRVRKAGSSAIAESWFCDDPDLRNAEKGRDEGGVRISVLSGTTRRRVNSRVRMRNQGRGRAAAPDANRWARPVAPSTGWRRAGLAATSLPPGVLGPTALVRASLTAKASALRAAALKAAGPRRAALEHQRA